MRGDLLWASHSRDGRVDAAARFGDADAVRRRRADGSRSSELVADVRRVTAALIASGIEPGERVAIWSPNRYEWLVAALGTLGAGAAVVPVNTRFKGDEVRHILERSGARVAFTVGEFLGMDYAATLAELRAAAPEPRRSSSGSTTSRASTTRSTRSCALGDAVDDAAVDARIARGAAATTCATCCSRRARPARRRAC